MAEILTAEGYACGRFVQVKNQHRRNGEPETYQAIFLVHKSDAKKGACYMFTQHEAKHLFTIDANSADMPLELGVLYNTMWNGNPGFLVNIESKFFSGGVGKKRVEGSVFGTRLVFISERKLSRVQRRAARNLSDNVGPEDAPKKTSKVVAFLKKTFGWK